MDVLSLWELFKLEINSLVFSQSLILIKLLNNQMFLWGGCSFGKESSVVEWGFVSRQIWSSFLVLFTDLLWAFHFLVFKMGIVRSTGQHRQKETSIRAFSINSSLYYHYYSWYYLQDQRIVWPLSQCYTQRLSPDFMFDG